MTSNILQSVNAINVFANMRVPQVQSSKKLFDWLRGPVESAGREAGRRLGFFVTYLAEGTGELTTLFGEHATRLHKRSAHTGGSLLPNPIVRDRLTLLPKLGRRRWRQDLTFLPTLAALSLPSRVSRVSSSQPPPRCLFFLPPPPLPPPHPRRARHAAGPPAKAQQASGSSPSLPPPAGLKLARGSPGGALVVRSASATTARAEGIGGSLGAGEGRRRRRQQQVKAAATPPPPPLPALPLGLPQAGWWP